MNKIFLVFFAFIVCSCTPIRAGDCEDMCTPDEADETKQYSSQFIQDGCSANCLCFEGGR